MSGPARFDSIIIFFIKKISKETIRIVTSTRSVVCLNLNLWTLSREEVVSGASCNRVCHPPTGRDTRVSFRLLVLEIKRAVLISLHVHVPVTDAEQHDAVHRLQPWKCSPSEAALWSRTPASLCPPPQQLPGKHVSCKCLQIYDK